MATYYASTGQTSLLVVSVVQCSGYRQMDWLWYFSVTIWVSNKRLVSR